MKISVAPPSNDRAKYENNIARTYYRVSTVILRTSTYEEGESRLSKFIDHLEIYGIRWTKTQSGEILSCRSSRCLLNGCEKSVFSIFVSARAASGVIRVRSCTRMCATGMHAVIVGYRYFLSATPIHLYRYSVKIHYPFDARTSYDTTLACIFPPGRSFFFSCSIHKLYAQYTKISSNRCASKFQKMIRVQGSNNRRISRLEWGRNTISRLLINFAIVRTYVSDFIHRT